MTASAPGGARQLGAATRQKEPDMQDQLFRTPQQGTTSDDYYTPPIVFETLNIDFDLDVSAPPGGVPWIPCKRYFTQEDNGLAQPWHGKVWMNPPYSQTTPWVHKFMDHQNGIALLPFARSKWLDKVWNSDAAIVQLPANSTFIRFGEPMSIRIPIFLMAYEPDDIQAIQRFGKVR